MTVLFSKMKTLQKTSPEVGLYFLHLTSLLEDVEDLDSTLYMFHLYEMIS